MFAEDLSAFFSTDDFAVAATYRARGGAAPRTVNGIFDREYADVLSVASSSPAFLCATSDVAEAHQDDRLEIAGERFKVKAVQPSPADYPGCTRLLLQIDR